MKIFVISPILPPEGEDYREQYRRRDSAQIPAEFSFAYIDKGPRFIQNAYDDACAAPDLIRKIQAGTADRPKKRRPGSLRDVWSSWPPAGEATWRSLWNVRTNF